MPVWAAIASTMSPVVTEPNSRPSPPALAVMVIVAGTSVLAISSAAAAVRGVA